MKIQVAIAAALVVSIVYNLVLFNQKLEIPPSLTAALKAEDGQRIDVLYVDAKPLDNEEMQQMVLPLLMVAKRRYPDKPQNFRIIVFEDDFMGYFRDGAAAGYDPDLDVFIVSLRKIRGNNPEVTRQQRWALSMGHESTHLWQRLRGDLKMYTDLSHYLATYRDNPLELEAYQEGVDLASSFPEWPVTFSLPDGSMKILPQEPNPYEGSDKERILQNTKIFVHNQRTAKGTFRSLF